MKNTLINLKPFRGFLSNFVGGIILLACLIVSLIIANRPLGSTLESFLNQELGYQSENVHLKYPLLLWINDG